MSTTLLPHACEAGYRSRASWRAATGAVWLAVALSVAAPASAVPATDGKPYDDRLMRLAEILGAVHYLRELCGSGDGQLWRERMPSFAVVERRAYPRLSALAEVVWSPREKRNYADFRARLPWLLARLDRLNVNYRRPRPGE